MRCDPLWFDLDGVRFGDGERVIVTDFSPEATEAESGDVTWQHPGVLTGRDVARGTQWAWSLATLERDEQSARAAIAPLAVAWRAAQSLAPGALQVLRYTMAGRTRRVYGRARRWSPPVSSPAIVQGVAQVVADFMVTDPLHYDDVAQQIQISAVPASSGGLLAPLVAPLSTLRSGTPDTRFATVGGDAPTPLTVIFRGPVVRPWVRVGSVRVALTGTLAYDQAVTVDARTRTVLWSAGRSGSAAGLLDPRARLADLALKPGRHEVQFGGTDETGTATCTVSWRDAWRSL